MSENTKRCPYCGNALPEDAESWVIDLLTEVRDVLGLAVSELKEENRKLKDELAAARMGTHED